eukprot:TRINITY_DN528_c1_g1_i1.p1 TRINITY_DN528_c1_g1~~TRINITY_DN528_c1_g1_i1.p1  ORF type:complete len:707 (-),score=123.12 TRINITY_DN528_c1_g1_i1:132-2114(-)
MQLMIVPCESYRVPNSLPRIVGVGDLHGDLRNCLRVLHMAGLINETAHWVGGDAILVQTGDVVDRGPYSREILDLFRDLRVQAASAGGTVLQLIGNHEIMALKGRHSYVHPRDAESFGSLDSRLEAFAETGPYAYIRDFPAIVTLYDTIFVHGGLASAFWAPPAVGFGPLNLETRRDLLRGDFDSRTMNQFVGPQWFRQDIMYGSQGLCRLVHAGLRASGYRRYIVGHTIQHGGVVGEFCGGALLAIDVSMSAYNKLGDDRLAFVELFPLRSEDAAAADADAGNATSVAHVARAADDTTAAAEATHVALWHDDRRGESVPFAHRPSRNATVDLDVVHASVQSPNGDTAAEDAAPSGGDVRTQAIAEEVAGQVRRAGSVILSPCAAPRNPRAERLCEAGGASSQRLVRTAYRITQLLPATGANDATAGTIAAPTSGSVAGGMGGAEAHVWDAAVARFAASYPTNADATRPGQDAVGARTVMGRVTSFLRNHGETVYSRLGGAGARRFGILRHGTPGTHVQYAAEHVNVNGGAAGTRAGVGGGDARRRTSPLAVDVMTNDGDATPVESSSNSRRARARGGAGTGAGVGEGEGAGRAGHTTLDGFPGRHHAQEGKRAATKAATTGGVPLILLLWIVPLCVVGGLVGRGYVRRWLARRKGHRRV